MAQPPAYNREKNFTLNSGRETDHSALNAELDRASNSINDIRANLAALQADDGKLRPFVVTPDSISEELRISLVEGVVMDAQAMLDESKAASEASLASAEKAKESEAAAAASAVQAEASVERAAEAAANVQGRADEIVRTASAQAKTYAGEAAQSAQSAMDSATQAQSVYELIDERAGEIVQTAASEARAHAQSAEASAGEAQVHAEVANQRGIPVGTVVMFSASEAPAGYLIANGAAVGRATYPDLFAAIGTTFGEGDGETTFNLPDSGYKRIDFDASTTALTAPGDGFIFAEASTSQGGFYLRNETKGYLSESGSERAWGLGTFVPCFKGDRITVATWQSTISKVFFATSPSPPFYGSDKGCLCIKAFDATVNIGLVDVTVLAQEVARKAERSQVANLAMPSEKKISLSVGESDTSYVAPAAGYVKFSARQDGVGEAMIGLYNVNTSFSSDYPLSLIDYAIMTCTLQVRKGDTFSIYRYGNLYDLELTFFYAEGSQP